MNNGLGQQRDRWYVIKSLLLIFAITGCLLFLVLLAFLCLRFGFGLAVLVGVPLGGAIGYVLSRKIH